MLGLHENKPMEKRGENTPDYDPHNKTDRKILLFVILSLVIVAILAVLFILIYIFWL